jgi:hypothetical protein
VKRELERMWMDAVVAQFPAVYLYLAGRTEKNYDKFPHPVMICD